MSLISFSAISDGTTIDASDVNNPLNTIYNDYNGNITDANISASAAISQSKIALATAGAATSSVAASETLDNTHTSYGALATAQAVTVTVGASGLLLVHIGVGTTSNDTADAFTYMSFALSSANTLAAADNVAAVGQEHSANVSRSESRTVLLTGLSAGSTVVTAQFKVKTGGSGAGTGTWVNRNLWALPL